MNLFHPNRQRQTKQNNNKKKDVAVSKEFGVELEDTILFPEGGGQPYDKEPSHYYPITQKSLKLNQF